MMNKKEIFRKIGGIIADLTEQYQYLSDNPKNQNELEMELFMANSRFLADHIVILKKLNEIPESPLPDVHQDHASIKTTHAEQKNKEEVAELSKDTHTSVADEPGQRSTAYEVAELPKTNNIDENQPEKNIETVEKNQPSEALSPLKPASEVIEEKAQVQNNLFQPEKKESPENNATDPIINEITIAEKTIAVPVESLPASATISKPTLNELLSANSNSGALARQFNPQAVTDLKSIINLNDKLLFIKDLFNGYSLAYSEAIELVNRFENFEAADKFLKSNYASKNNWPEKQNTVDKFYEILHRRFSK